MIGLFFSKSPSERWQDKSGNVKAGFVVTKGLESPFSKDFYLLSHGGLKGSTHIFSDLALSSG